MDLLKETSRSARLKYLLASVTDPSLCPQRLNHLTLTAGRDSKRSFYRQHFQRASFRWFKLSTKHRTFYSSAFLFSTISKSGGELIGQPDQHHRVVTQLPPSLDGGLDGQSLSILFFFSLLLPYKGHGAIIKLIGESFYARCPRRTYQTPFNVKLEQHHRMQFFASIFALAKILYLIHQTVYSYFNESSDSCVHFSSDFPKGTFRSTITRKIYLRYMEKKPINFWNNGNWSAAENIPCIPFVLQFIGSGNTSFPRTCKRLNGAVAGRSRYNCHCEGLLVSFFLLVTSQN